MLLEILHESISHGFDSIRAIIQIYTYAVMLTFDVSSLLTTILKINWTDNINDSLEKLDYTLQCLKQVSELIAGFARLVG